MNDRTIYSFREDLAIPGRFEIRRHRVPVGEIRFEIPFGDAAVRAGIRLMVEDAVRLWDSAARADDVWIRESP